MEALIFFIIISIVLILFGFIASSLKSKNTASTLEVKSFSHDFVSYKVDTRVITCTCPNFIEDRSKYQIDDPRRLCKHLIKKMWETNSLPQDLIFYKDGIKWSYEYGKGFSYYDGEKIDIHINGKKFTIFTHEMDNEDDPDIYWIEVYCENKRYSYTANFEKWALDNPPPHEEQIIRLIYEKMGEPIPPLIPSDSLKTLSCEQIDDNTYLIKSEIDRIAINAEIKPKSKNIYYWVNKEEYSGNLNIETGDFKLPRMKYLYIQEAIKKWLTDEYNKIKGEYEKAQSEKRERKFKTTEDELKAFQIIQSFLKDHLSLDDEITFKDTQSYFSVTINNSRKWICRLYLNSEKAKYLELPDGKRFEINNIEDIAKYKEQLIKIYLILNKQEGL